MLDCFTAGKISGFGSCSSCGHLSMCGSCLGTLPAQHSSVVLTGAFSFVVFPEQRLMVSPITFVVGESVSPWWYLGMDAGPGRKDLMK